MLAIKRPIGTRTRIRSRAPPDRCRNPRDPGFARRTGQRPGRRRAVPRQRRPRAGRRLRTVRSRRARSRRAQSRTVPSRAARFRAARFRTARSDPPSDRRGARRPRAGSARARPWRPGARDSAARLCPLPAGLHIHRGEAEHPGEQRALQIDALDPIERGAAVLPEDDAAALLDGLRRDAEGVEPPGEPGDEDDERDRSEHHQQGDHDQALPDDEVDEIALARAERVQILLRDEETEEVIAEVREEDAADHDEHQAAAQQRRQRVQTTPVGGGGRGILRLIPDLRRAFGRAVRGGHSPDRRVSASSTRRSRSASASSRGRPGRRTPVATLAVTNFRVASPSARSSGPRVTSTSCSRP